MLMRVALRIWTEDFIRRVKTDIDSSSGCSLYDSCHGVVAKQGGSECSTDDTSAEKGQ